MRVDPFQLQYGLLYDFRNPALWQRSWDDLYEELLQQIAATSAHLCRGQCPIGLEGPGAPGPALDPHWGGKTSWRSILMRNAPPDSIPPPY